MKITQWPDYTASCAEQPSGKTTLKCRILKLLQERHTHHQERKHHGDRFAFGLDLAREILLQLLEDPAQDKAPSALKRLIQAIESVFNSICRLNRIVFTPLKTSTLLASVTPHAIAA